MRREREREKDKRRGGLEESSSREREVSGLAGVECRKEIRDADGIND